MSDLWQQHMQQILCFEFEALRVVTGVAGEIRRGIYVPVHDETDGVAAVVVQSRSDGSDPWCETAYLRAW